MTGKLSAAAFALVLAFAGSSHVQAQKGFKLGAIILPQYSLMMNQTDTDLPEDEFKYKHTFGMGAGITTGYNFGDGVGFRLNALYSVQGQHYTNINANDQLVRNYRRLHYLKVPLMVGFNTNTEYARVVFSVYGGFQAGLLMHARYWNDDETYTPDELLWTNITDYPKAKDQYNFLDYGPVADIGVDIKLTYNVMANVHIRADYSLTDAEDKAETYKFTEFGQTDIVPFYPSDRAETTNLTGGIMFGVTYTFTAQ